MRKLASLTVDSLAAAFWHCRYCYTNCVQAALRPGLPLKSHRSGPQ